MERLPIKKDNIRYDEEHDVLHVHFRPYSFSEDEEELPGVIVRRSIKNPLEIISIVIFDFAKRRYTIELLQHKFPEYDFSTLENLDISH